MRSTIGTITLSLILAPLGCSTSNTKPPPADGGPGGGGTGGGTGGSFAVTWRPDTPVSPLFIGSGGFAYAIGSCSMSATAPNGLVKVGPDTDGPMGQLIHYAGYWYGDDTIQGF